MTVTGAREQYGSGVTLHLSVTVYVMHCRIRIPTFPPSRVSACSADGVLACRPSVRIWVQTHIERKAQQRAPAIPVLRRQRQGVPSTCGSVG